MGAGVGLLIAPASGEETRADIANKISDFGKKVSDRVKPQERNRDSRRIRTTGLPITLCSRTPFRRPAAERKPAVCVRTQSKTATTDDKTST